MSKSERSPAPKPVIPTGAQGSGGTCSSFSSRTENFILDHDHIRFEEYEPKDEGKTWTKTSSGTEERTAG